MDEAERIAAWRARLVRGVETAERADQNRPRDRRRAPLARVSRPLDELRERGRVDVLHDEEHVVAGADHVVHRGDVRVVDARLHPTFVDQRRDELRDPSRTGRVAS